MCLDFKYPQRISREEAPLASFRFFSGLSQVGNFLTFDIIRID